MSRVILLDAGPLGLITNPRRSARNTECTQWLQRLVVAGVRVIVPEIADYEIRRELLRANKTEGVAQLDSMNRLLEYLPLNTSAMRKAAEFWAQARQQGRPTAHDRTIDGDMILAAQAMTLGTFEVVIATTNVGHLSRFAPAELWQNISVE